MKRLPYAPVVGATFILLTAVLAACGGGGGGGGTTGGGGVTPSTQAPATATPAATATPGSSGTMSFGGQPLANAKVVFTCGCSQQAGLETTDANGNFTVTATATAVPATPNPTYTAVPGRNYMVIGFAAQSHLQLWTLEFIGKTPATNLNLGSPSTNGAPVSDTAASAAALYVYQLSQNNSDTSFDEWNFNVVAAWAQHLRTGPVTTAEQKLMSDITTAQANAQNLFPIVPVWDPSGVGAANANVTINRDIQAIAAAGVAADAALPTPCPTSGCTGAPAP